QRVRPDAASVGEASTLLVEARRPIVIVGDEVWKSGAHSEMVGFAQKLGLPVTMTGLQAYRNFPVRHPHYLGNFSLGSAYVRGGAALLLFIGARDLRGKVIPRGAEIPAGA